MKKEEFKGVIEAFKEIKKIIFLIFYIISAFIVSLILFIPTIPIWLINKKIFDDTIPYKYIDRIFK